VHDSIAVSNAEVTKRSRIVDLFISVGRFLMGQEEEEVTGERKGGAGGIEKNLEGLDPTFVTD